MKTFKKALSMCLTVLMVLGVMSFNGLQALAIGDFNEAVSMGFCHAMTLKGDGTLWVWGSNGKGSWTDQGYPEGGGILGTNEDTEEHTPIKIMDDVASFSSGGWFALAVKTDKSLWAWGNNFYGELGDGTTDSKIKPVKIMDDVASVSAGGYHGMAIKTDGSLWVWGENGAGALGDGTTVGKTTPIKIMDGVISAYGFARGSMAIKSDGSLWAWGGIFGSNVPVKIMDDAVSMASYSGDTAVMVVKKDGSLWARGRNENGDVGDGTTTQRDSFVKIMDSVAKVSVGWKYTMAVKTDGSLWAWGYNEYGQLGDGTTTDRHSPVKIMDGVSSISAGMMTSIATKTDGSVWTWGFSEAGILGDGTMADRSAPVKILDGTATTPTPPPPPPAPALTAIPTASTVLVNGEQVAFDAYNIGGNNYFKLRDLAFAVNGSEKQFEVAWDGAANAISLTSGKTYTAVGGEMTGKGAGNKTPVLTTSKILLDGEEVTFTAYNIDGNNYFKLRDVGQAFDFGVEWDGAKNTIVIDTSKGYTPE